MTNDRPNLPLRRRVIDLVRRPFQLAPLERLLASMTEGQPPERVVSRFAPRHYQYPRSSTRRAERYDLQLDLDLSDMIQWYVYFGFTDPSHEQLLAFCRPGDVVIDVGANVGITVLRAARRVGPNGRVYAFEPDPDNYRRLRANCDANEASNVHLINAGASDADGEAFLRVLDPHNSGMHSIASPGESGGTRVELTTIDHLVEREGIARVDLIKIDTEGFELIALRGARQTLERHRPVIFFELDDAHLRRQRSTAGELIGWLEARGYAVTRADSSRTLRPTDDFAGFHGDAVARAR